MRAGAGVTHVTTPSEQHVAPSTGRRLHPLGASAVVVLCNRCRRAILPKKFGSTLRDANRGDGIHDTERDSEQRAPLTIPPLNTPGRKAARTNRSLRAVTRDVGIVGAMKLLLDARQLATVPASEDCADCLALTRLRTRRA